MNINLYKIALVFFFVEGVLKKLSIMISLWPGPRSLRGNLHGSRTPSEQAPVPVLPRFSSGVNATPTTIEFGYCRVWIMVGIS